MYVCDIFMKEYLTESSLWYLDLTSSSITFRVLLTSNRFLKQENLVQGDSVQEIMWLKR